MQPVHIHVHVLEHFGRDAFPFLDQAQKNMFRSNVIMVEATRFFHGQFQYFFGARRKGNFITGYRGRLRMHVLLYFSYQLFRVNAQIFQGMRGDALGLFTQAQQNMFRADILAAETYGFLTRCADYMFSSLCKPFPHINHLPDIMMSVEKIILKPDEL